MVALEMFDFGLHLVKHLLQMVGKTAAFVAFRLGDGKFYAVHRKTSDVSNGGAEHDYFRCLNLNV